MSPASPTRYGFRQKRISPMTTSDPGRMERSSEGVRPPAFSPPFPRLRTKWESTSVRSQKLVAFDQGRLHYLLEVGELETLELCNGATPVNDILQSGPSAEALLHQLWDDGLLVGSEGRARRLAMTGLGIEMSGLTPILAWLCRRIRWIFHPVAIGIAAALERPPRRSQVGPWITC